MSRGDEKRAVKRIEPFVARCQVSFGVHSRVAYMTDLSPRGARLACDQALPDHATRISLAVRLGGGDALTHLAAEVKWSRPRSNGKGFMVGVRFVDLPREARDRLESAVEEFRANAERLA